MNNIINSINDISIRDNAIIYTRSSSAMQNNFHNHFSIDSQYGICLEYCSQNNYTILEHISEIRSARDINKQSLLLNIINNHSNCNLIVADASRLSRDFINGISFMNKCKMQNINIISVRDNLNVANIQDNMQFNNNLFLAKHESDLISMRIKSAITYRKRSGKYVGKQKYGYYIKQNIATGQKNIVINKKEFDTIKLIKLLYNGSTRFQIIELMKLIKNSDNNNIGSSLTEVIDNQLVDIQTVKYGNFCYVDIANILNHEQITHKGKVWTSLAIARLCK